MYCWEQHLLTAILKNFPRKRFIVMSNGVGVPIIRKLVLIPSRTELSEQKALSSRVTSAFDAVQIVEHIIIPPQTEVFVPVKSRQADLQIIEGRNDLWDKKRLIAANGVADLKLNPPSESKLRISQITHLLSRRTNELAARFLTTCHQCKVNQQLGKVQLVLSCPTVTM